MTAFARAYSRLARMATRVFYLVLNMARAMKRIPRVATSAPPRRDQIIGLRLRDGDRRRLEEMARVADVGVSTFARLVIEKYIETHGSRRKA